MKKNFFKEYEKENTIKDFNETFEGVSFNELPERKDYNHAAKIRKIKLGIGYSFLSAFVATFLVIGVPFAAFIISGIQIENRVTSTKKTFSKADMEIVTSNTFKKLNSITYPNESRKPVKVSDEFIKSTNEFTKTIYTLSNDKENLNYAPYSLYSNLDLLSVIVNDSFQDEFNELLGMTKEARKSDVIDTFLNNFKMGDEQGIYLFNGLFIDNDLKIKNERLNELTKRYVETFEMDFKNKSDIDKMLLWINNHHEGEDVKIEDLKPDDPNFIPKFLAASSFYFNYKRYNKFSDSDTYEDEFYLLDGSIKKHEYMKHSYFGDIYRYNNYDSIYDYYNDGYSIQYIAPHDTATSIYEVTKDINFLEEDETKKEYCPIEINVPKFTKKSSIDFSEILSKSSIKDIYVSSGKSIDAFKESFDTTFELPLQLSYTKQQNEITFSEDGTEIKTITWSLGGASTAPFPDGEGYIVNLNSPFIYIIRDVNNIPLYFGAMNE